MHKPGRNDPCPCGSGRKFKRCCATAAETAAPAITDDDRANAFDTLDRLSQWRRFAAELSAATELVTPKGDLPGPLDDPDDDVAIARFLEWFAFDVVLADGRTLADIVLAEYASRLTPGARRLIDELRGAPLRLLEVGSVSPDGSVRCRDLIDPQPVHILFPTIDLVPNDVFAARLVERDETFDMEGAPALIFPEEGNRFVRLIGKLRRRMQRATRSPQLARMAEGAALLRWIAVYEAIDDEIHTREGDPLELTHVIFDVLDADAFGRAVAAAPDIERQSADASCESYVMWSGDADDDRYPLGVFALSAEQVLLLAMSPERAERARERLVALAQDAVRFVGFESADPGAGATSAPAPRRSPA